MKAIGSGYFDRHPLKRDIRASLVTLGMLLAAAGVVLVLQSFLYASSIRQLLEAGQNLWGQALGQMLQVLGIWAFVLGAMFAIRFVTQPEIKYGAEFWEAVVTGFPWGLALPFLLALGAALCIYIPLGLLSLFVPEVFPYATLQFAGLAAAYLVFLWIVVGMVPVLVEVFSLPKWYYKLIAILLFVLLSLDVLQAGMNALRTLLVDSVWQTNDVALLLGLFGSLIVSIAAVLWSLRGLPALTLLYAIAGIYLASLVTGNFSERLFGWGEIPAAIVAFLSPLLYLQVTKWILRRDGTAVACLAAGFAGLLAGLLVDLLLQLRITGQGWLSLLWGVIVVLGVGLALGYFLGRRLNRLLTNRLNLQVSLLKYMDTGLVTGIMAGMLIGGLLAR